MKNLLQIAAALLAATSSSCSFQSAEVIEIQSTGVQKIALFGTSDFHGALRERESQTADGQTFNAGGAAIFKAHVDHFKNEWGSRGLILSAGDDLHGSLESLFESGEPLTQFFNTLGIHASTIGSHDFDYGPSANPEQGIIRDRIGQSQFPWISSNIQLSLPNLRKNAIFNVGDLRVGIIGVTTPSIKLIGRQEFTQALQLEAMKTAILRESGTLRQQGAQIIVLLANVPQSCTGNPPAPPVLKASVWKPNTPQSPCQTEGRQGELAHLVSTLPENAVDAIIGGQSHQILHHWLKTSGDRTIPVIEGGAYGLYYNLISMTYDFEKQKLLDSETQIEGPIPVCRKVFQNTQNCEPTSTPSEDRGPLVTPTLFGKKIHPDSGVEESLAQLTLRNLPKRSEQIGIAARAIPHDKLQESELGNLLADALLAKAKTDFALINPGSMRNPLSAGPLTFESVFRAVPFDSLISVLRVNGSQLKNILKVANCGARGFFSVAGLQLKFIDLESQAPSRDLNENHKIEHWETDRLLEVRKTNGERIINSRMYTLATSDFLAQGGDDLEWAISKIPENQIQLNAGGLVRDALIEQIKQASPLNSPQHPLINPELPRIRFKRR